MNSGYFKKSDRAGLERKKREIQIFRLMILTSDNQSLSRTLRFDEPIHSEKDVPQYYPFDHYALTVPAQLSNIPISILGLMIDTGRLNAIVDHDHTSFFQDMYFREVRYNAHYKSKNIHASLMNSNISSTDRPPLWRINIAPDMAPILKQYFGEKFRFKKGKMINTIGRRSSLFFPSEIPVDQIEMEKTLTTLDDVSTLLSRLGAFPNRDVQLRHYVKKKFRDTTDLRKQYYLKMKAIYPALSVKSSTEYVYSPSFIVRKKTQLQCTLGQYTKKTIELNSEIDARHFYYQVLYKLIESLPNQYENTIQSSLAFDRIDLLLQDIDHLEYALFLRMIELCIDEIILILALEKSNASARLDLEETLNILRQFIVNTIGIEPNGMTLRSSAMHAFSTSMALIIDGFQREYQSSALCIFVEETIYFEMYLALQYMLKLSEPAVFRHGIIIDEDKRIQLIPHKHQMIYDVYIASFESNVVSEQTKRVVDLGLFIQNQFVLRMNSDESLPIRPLVVLIDHTISDVDEVYLPSLLQEFKAQIDSGRLILLVIHSGNKYLTLGTDKGLAALLYGYYNPEGHLVAQTIAAMFEKERRTSELGGFSPDSPTVLLTTRYLSSCLTELKCYKKNLHRKTSLIYQALSDDELIPNGYFALEPLSRFQLFFNRELMQHKSSFLTIYSHGFNHELSSLFSGHEERKTLFELAIEGITMMLEKLNIHFRDTFGVSQTTYLGIQSGGQQKMRISIGTEDTQALILKMKAFMHFINAINPILDQHNAQVIGNEEQTIDIFKESYHNLIVVMALFGLYDAPKEEDFSSDLSRICRTPS